MNPEAREALSCPCGIVLLDKPLGMSSNAAMQKLRRLYGRPKAGHTGSLDPLASGMLPICIGEATKLAGELLSQRKAYRFTLNLGVATRTGDAEGEIVATQPIPTLTDAAIDAALQDLTGPQEQVPPMFSALKREGRPLYQLAREGREVERAARRIEILRLQRLSRDAATLSCEVECSKGTYVRTLGEDLAARLGTVGHLGGLRRLYVDPFAGETLWTLEQLEDPAAREQALLPADRAVPHLPAVRLDDVAVAELRFGRSVPPGSGGAAQEAIAPDAEGLRLYDGQDRFIGLGRTSADGTLRVRRLFVSARST